MSINKAILIGNVGRDPEIRHLDKNVSVANFTLATTERGFTMQNGTQVPERTEWHNIVAWRGLAELAEKYIRKGTQLYIEGKIQTRSWEKEGIKRYTTEIYADTIQLLGKKPEQTPELPAENITTQTSAPAASNTPDVEPPLGEGADDLPF
ncbi:MAG: single-stranded DNA-binding protein [Porphyromonadaceae bacterium]|nr:single-stranded DNA-binding protein [Porphyromonadaceae bacterium]